MLQGEGHRTENSHTLPGGVPRGVSPLGTGSLVVWVTLGGRRPGLLSRWLLEKKFLRDVPRAVLGPNITVRGTQVLALPVTRAITDAVGT